MRVWKYFGIILFYHYHKWHIPIKTPLLNCLSIYSGVNGYLDDIPINEVGEFEKESLIEIRSKHQDLLDSIETEKELTKENSEILKSFFDNFLINFKK